MNVTGKARVYQFEHKGNYAKASLQVGKKKGDEWENMWFNARFIGKNTPDELEKGQTIDITSAVLESFKGGKGTYVTVVIFEFNLLDTSSKAKTQGQLKDKFPDKCPACGELVEYCKCELPF